MNSLNPGGIDDELPVRKSSFFLYFTLKMSSTQLVEKLDSTNSLTQEQTHLDDQLNSSYITIQ